MASKWASYDRWGSVLRNLVYDGRSAHQPVYLNMENDLLLQAASILDLPLEVGVAQQDLVSAVKEVLELEGRTAHPKMFRRILHRLDEWYLISRADESGHITPPPVLPVLAVFSRAAEIMGENEDYTSQAYYRPLMSLLGVTDDDKARLEQAFRLASEVFWDALNDWLRDLDGRLGLPTAEPLGHRYVGIPLSQALMRDADRKLLLAFFENQRLQPGTPLSAKDMKVHLGDWFSRGKGSVSMKAMWRSKDGKSILADAACQALVSWDGTQVDDSGNCRKALPPLITARIRRVTFGRARFHFGFVIRGTTQGTNALASEWQVDSSPAEPKPILEMQPLTDRLLAPASMEEVEAGALVAGTLRLSPRVSDSNSDLAVERRPQPIVVMVQLEEAGRYLEVENARLGESHLVLVNTAARKPNGEPLFELEPLLREIAPPGFTEVKGVDGLPAGWMAYRDVVVMRRHDRKEMALDPLRPAQTSTLVASEGLRLPGQVVRWSSRVPLTVRAVSDEEAGVRIRLLSHSEVAANSEICVWEAGEAEWVGSTAGLELNEGLYRLELRRRSDSERTQAIATHSFSLCSGRNPRQHGGSGAIEYRPGVAIDGLLPGEISANPPVQVDTTAVGFPGPVVVGAEAIGTYELASPDGRQPEPIWWRTERNSVKQPALAEPAPPDSCAITGSHHEIIELHVPGQLDRGECQECGRIRMYRGTAPRKKTAITAAVATRPQLDHLKTSGERRQIDGLDVLDALVWLGGGPISEFNSVVRQVNDSALTADETLRVLEALGHIDVQRDGLNVAPTYWRMAPACVVGHEGYRWTLVGCWQKDSLDAARHQAAKLGGALTTQDTGWLPTRVITGLDAAAASDVARAAGARCTVNAGWAILKTLRPIVDIASNLPRISAENIYDVEWFNTANATWSPVETMNQPGAYRIRNGFVSTYVLRDANDVQNKTMARANPHVAKCFAARQRPLVAYERDTRQLQVPLGAELPGLYGRAITLMSGRPPGRANHQPLVVYEDVQVTAAAHLYWLLKERSS